MLIETTISENYVPSWGVAQGVREIMQNALDADDQGFKMGVSYLRKKRQLLIWNKDVELSTDNLLLGSTTKDEDSNLRGKYGEGFKIGSLSLVRKDKPVTIYNGNSGYKWEPLIQKHSSFKSNVLVFNIQKDRGISGKKLLFEIGNICPEEWYKMKDMFLNIYSPSKKTVLKSLDGDVLLEKGLKGKIYCGSIYVSTNKALQYGYNFLPSVLKLNRDRNMIDDFNLKWATSKLWAYLSANSKGRLYDVKTMLKEGVPDVEFMDSFSDYTVTGSIVEDFFKENNSHRSYPVINKKEASEVTSLGYRPVYSSASYSNTLRKNLGGIEDLKRRVELDYSLFQNITAVDDANIQWVFEVMHKVDDKFNLELNVAKFSLDTTRSVPEDRKLVINSNIIHCKYEILQEVIKFYAAKQDLLEGSVWKTVYKQTFEFMSKVATL